MKTKNLYELSVLSKFYSEYNVSKDELLTNHHTHFRYLCFRYIDFMRHIDLPPIKQKLYYEAVLIEYRIFPHLEFLIRNTILKLGKKWSYTVICGTNNYDFMVEMCGNISTNIKIIKTNFDNLTPSEYSEMLTSTWFWDLFDGYKILIYQEDSIIFKENVDEFLLFDFIGAPFPKGQNDTPNCVGNGGLSIRTKLIMKEIIETYDIETVEFNSSTLEYFNFMKLTFPPEDVYFSKCMQDKNIGKVADWETAFRFSSESVLNGDSFAGHKFWISHQKWKRRMKSTFPFNLYKFNNDIKRYLAFKGLPLDYDKTPTIGNAFDVDLQFCSFVNNLQNVSEFEVMKYIKNTTMQGYIYHPKQIYNLYPKANIYTFMDVIFIEYKTVIYRADEFVESFIYNKSFDYLTKRMITNLYDNLDKTNDLLLLVFVGNETVGKLLIDKIINYKSIQKFNIAFCFNSQEVANSFKKVIKRNFTNYSIYISKEMGTDITPTLLMYNDISNKYTFKHVIKVHTKSILPLFHDLTNELLSMPLSKLVEYKRNDCNCIGHPKQYVGLKHDPWNKVCLTKSHSNVDIKKKFVAGTIFYAENLVFDAVIKFMKENNFRSYLLNTLYENNSINRDYSPIHFLERLFGIINL